MNRCACTRIPAHPQPHLRHICFNKNLSNQLPRCKLESLFIECSSRSVVIQWAHPPTLDTADDGLLKCIFFSFSRAQAELIPPNRPVNIVYWPAQKVPHTMYCRIKFSPNVTNAITFAESHKSSSGKQLKKGGSNVVLCVYPAVPGFWYSAKHGSLKAKNSHTSQKMQRGKAMRCRSDIDSFRCKDSWWGGCHQYRCLFVVAILSCCQSLSPGVLLWFEWIMRRRSEWTIFSSTW